MERINPGFPQPAEEPVLRQAHGTELRRSFQTTIRRITRAVDGIKKLYPDGTWPIFYRTDSNLHKLISHQSLNLILFVARGCGVIPIPFRVGMRAYYPQTELVTALSYARRQVSLGASVSSLVADVWKNLSSNPRLTIGDSARILGFRPGQFRRLVAEGVLPVGDDILRKSFARIHSPSSDKRPMVNPDLLADRKVNKALQKWRRRYVNLENLTHFRFQVHRESFATVREVAQMADVHPDVCKGDFETLSQILTTGGIRVEKLDHFSKGRFIGSYWILSAEEKERAVRILERDPTALHMGRQGVEQIAGPKLRLLPTKREMNQDRQKYLSVICFLRSHGLKVGYGASLTVEDFLSGDCPAVIIKYQRSRRKRGTFAVYVCPCEQQEALADYSLRRRAEIV